MTAGGMIIALPEQVDRLPGFGRNDARHKADFLYLVISFLTAMVLLVAVGLSFFSGTAPAGVATIDKIRSGAEWVLGIWLLSSWWPRFSWYAAAATLSVFVIVAGWHLVQGQSDCGCFGRLKVHPAITVFFDAALLLSMAWCGSKKKEWKPNCAEKNTWRLLCGLSIPFVVYAAQMSHASGGVIVLTPTDWIGKPFAMLNVVDSKKELTTGRHLVVLYDHDCEHCRKHLAALAAAENVDDLRQTIWTLDIAARDKKIVWATDAPFPALSLRMDSMYVAHVPADIHIANGIVEDVVFPDTANSMWSEQTSTGKTRPTP